MAVLLRVSFQGPDTAAVDVAGFFLQDTPKGAAFMARCYCGQVTGETHIRCACAADAYRKRAIAYARAQNP